MSEQKTEKSYIGLHSMSACVEVGKLLTSTLNLSEILNLVMQRVSELIKADHWSLLLVDENTNELTFEIVTGVHREKLGNVRLSLNQGIAGLVASTGESVFIQDVSQDDRFYPEIDQITGFKTESIICIPLKAHGKVLGVIEILNSDDLEIFKYNELPFLSIMADFCAIAIENSRYLDRIKKMSITDEYTGLYNARYLHEILENLVNEAKDAGKKLGVVFIDVDNFKSVVDTYGHLMGTEVLKEIGELISSCLDKQDILIKYGGDEYVIIFKEKSREEVCSVLEDILNKIRKTKFLADKPNPVSATVSFGLAMFPEDAKSKKDLLIQADNFMFDIKRSTKNGIGMRTS